MIERNRNENFLQQEQDSSSSPLMPHNYTAERNSRDVWSDIPDGHGNITRVK